MKAEVKIPKGWRKLEIGEQIKGGDAFAHGGRWMTLHGVSGYSEMEDDGEIYIRKVARRVVGKGGK